MIASTAVLPSLDCYRLRHRLEQRLKQPGPGAYDVCVHCSLGYAMALTQYGGDEAMADRFVQSLRAERTPV